VIEPGGEIIKIEGALNAERRTPNGKAGDRGRRFLKSWTKNFEEEMDFGF
jgi:hypothetical protein